MEKPICVACKIRDVWIKKHQLCSPCYQKNYRLRALQDVSKLPKFSFKAQKADKEKAEMVFVRNYFKHSNWLYKPGLFRFPNGARYEPDFLDLERNVWIGVSGTRQAYHQAKEKYEMFMSLFSCLKLEIRLPSGELLDEAEKGEKWAYQYKQGKL